MNEYFKISRSGSYSFIAALPLVIGYELLMLFSGSTMRVSAETLTKSIVYLPNRLIQSIFSPELAVSYGHWAFMFALLIVGATIFTVEHKEKLPTRPVYFSIMLGESILWVPIFALSVGFLAAKANPGLIARQPLAAANLGGLGFFGKIGLSMGAGVYEELIFRVCLVGAMVALGKKIFPKDTAIVYGTSIFIGALIFSAVHHMGSLGDPWNLTTFIFRTIAGILLNILFLTRGFGVAAWTHALYDMVVLLHMG